MDILVDFNSNTTLVKVKSVDVLSINNDVYDSNTTLVKVKSCNTITFQFKYQIQIQHLLKLNSYKRFICAGM